MNLDGQSMFIRLSLWTSSEDWKETGFGLPKISWEETGYQKLLCGNFSAWTHVCNVVCVFSGKLKFQTHVKTVLIAWIYRADQIEFVQNFSLFLMPNALASWLPRLVSSLVESLISSVGFELRTLKRISYAHF